MKGLFALLPMAFLLVSCATAAPAPCPQPTVTAPAAVAHQPLDRYERRIITAGAPAEVMALVENDTPSDDAFLREKALTVDPAEPIIGHLAARMLETVKKAPGVGIAAPQVGISRRLIWVQRMDKEEKPFEFYINPRIDEFSPEKEIGWEGCLSVPAGFGKCYRSTSITLSHDTTDNGRVSEKISGFTAVIFQHEIDHLDGVLFIDLKEQGDLMPKEAYYEMRRKEKEAKEKEQAAPAATPENK
ncbi:MAG TPA: peptide deformylase [bacterium]|nr:peptide deformylase [bacterium]